MDWLAARTGTAHPIPSRMHAYLGMRLDDGQPPRPVRLFGICPEEIPLLRVGFCLCLRGGGGTVESDFAVRTTSLRGLPPLGAGARGGRRVGHCECWFVFWNGEARDCRASLKNRQSLFSCRLAPGTWFSRSCGCGWDDRRGRSVVEWRVGVFRATKQMLRFFFLNPFYSQANLP